ncbi:MULTISPECIES: hypothetical protein [Sporosarcina]|uniref:TcaA NTF2-like domain-containing protein n=1 Tax=Sporosarcina sp. FSL K6-3508 TaxID=2921557 RepID=UPI00099B0C03|nr:hypothetical protein [Sporosarcina newyorkensis]
MNSLNSRDVELIDHSISSMEKLAPNKYKVTVNEQYSIYEPEKWYSESSQTSHYTVDLLDGSFYIKEFSFK